MNGELNEQYLHHIMKLAPNTGAESNTLSEHIIRSLQRIHEDYILPRLISKHYDDKIWNVIPELLRNIHKAQTVGHDSLIDLVSELQESWNVIICLI